MNRPVPASALIFLLLLASAAHAQPGVPPPDPANLRGESTQTRKRLAEAEQKLLGGKVADAADDLQRIMDESGDDLVTTDGQQFQSTRAVVHSLLAKLPPDALKAYQDRIDQPAKKLLDQAKLTRDARPLWQLLDRYFVSRPADEAILLLGDLLFERGEFRTAENVWRRLLPGAGADVVYPGSKADPALVRARIALAVIFQNDAGRAASELSAFKAKFPAATGTLAGKTGPLADTLQGFLDARPKLPPDAAAGAEWPTYGGGPDRTSRVPGGLPPWPSRPSWAEDIPEGVSAKQPRRLLLPPAHPPFGYPAIMNGEVFLASETHVISYNLQSGQPMRKFAGEANRRFPGAAGSLTAAGGLLYARLGPGAVLSPEGVPAGQPPSESRIVCLRPKGEKELTELWRLNPPEDDKVPVAWEGAPVVRDRRLWAVYAKFEGGRVIHVAACYDPADSETTPAKPAWKTELCDGPQPGAGRERVRQELLTLAGRHIVFCSNSGAVVAVDAVTGQHAWGFRYARSRKAIGNPDGTPAPAVSFGGRVFVAPADGERVYALDAETGRLVWESGPTEGARILGVARNRLIVTAAGPLRSIRGLNLETGSYRESEGGWIQHSGSGILSYGHGLVSDDVIVWPSRAGLYFLRPESGQPMGDPFFSAAQVDDRAFGPIRNYFGHVAYASGVLVVVTPTQVWGYRAQSRKIETRPDTPPLKRFDAMIDRAERELAAGRTQQGSAILAEVASSDLPPPFRAWAAARMLQFAPAVRQQDQLPPDVRDALRPDVLNEWILPPDGIPVTLSAFLQRRLGQSPPAGSAPACSKGHPPRPPELAADADADRTVKLPHAVAPLRIVAGSACPPKRLFAAGPRVVVAVPLDRGGVSEHTPADLFTHAADLPAGFVLAGPFAVAVYGVAREPLWVFRVPLTERLPAGVSEYRAYCGREPAHPQLSSFVLAGSWLLARIGDHHLIALDLQARRVAWVLSAGGRPGYDPHQFPHSAQFGPCFAIIGKFAAVQLSDGRRWFVELLTGRPAAMPAFGGRTARAWWPTPPLTVGKDQLLLADGPGLVRLVQAGGRVKWAYESESEEGLAGEPAQMRMWDDVLLVAVRRNYGVDVERVSPADGKPAWSRGPAFVDADRIDLLAADADADHAYITAGNKLLALTLTGGKVAWEAELPDAHSPHGWVVRAGKNCVIAYPAEAIPAEPTAAVWARLLRSFQREPFVWRLPGLAGTLYDAWVDRAVPVLLFDPETGKRLGRVSVPARGPAVTAWLDADTAVIATGDRVVWLK